MNIDIKLWLKRGISSLMEEVQAAIFTVKDKGWRRFLRAFLSGAAFIAAPYIFMQMADAQLGAINARIGKAKSEFESAQSYKSLSDSLADVYAQVLSGKQKSDWLSSTVLDCLKQENVIADSVIPKEERMDSDAVLDESVSVSADMDYAQLLAVINRLEHLKPRVRIVSLHVKKNSHFIGSNGVELEIETLVPSQWFMP